MILIIILLYLIGSCISYGVSAWMDWKRDVQYVKYMQPLYQKPWHSPITAIVTICSWLGVIVIVCTAFSFYKSVGIRWSFKPLWDEWIKSNSKL